MDQLRLLAELWPILVTIIGLTAWISKLESSKNRNKEKIAELEINISNLWVEHNALNNNTLTQLSQIRESLARIEGRLSVTVIE